MLVTLLVLNEYKSIDFKVEQLSNIKLISLTLLVINEDKFIDSKFLQP